MNLSAMKPHIIGLAALSAVLFVLAYTANTATVRRVASLSHENPPIAQQAPAQSPNVEPTRAAEESTSQRLKNQIKAMLPSLASNSTQNESMRWNSEDWRIAEKAVADHRNGLGARNANAKKASSDLVWQPPEEIR
ncbi:hypothetical protein [Methylocystis bryophila]|nr:hypothetical protein [Methylocystis bryophila]